MVTFSIGRSAVTVPFWSTDAAELLLELHLIRLFVVFQGVKETDNLQVVPVPIEDSLPPDCRSSGRRNALGRRSYSGGRISDSLHD